MSVCTKSVVESTLHIEATIESVPISINVSVLLLHYELSTVGTRPTANAMPSVVLNGSKRLPYHPVVSILILWSN